MDATVRSDYDIQPNDTLIFRLAGFFGEFRLGLKNDSWCGHAIFAQVENPWANARSAMAGANAATVSCTDAAAHAGSVRNRHKFGKRITDLTRGHFEIGNDCGFHH